jgi:hypothetical protein
MFSRLSADGNKATGAGRSCVAAVRAVGAGHKRSENEKTQGVLLLAAPNRLIETEGDDVWQSNHSHCSFP